MPKLRAYSFTTQKIQLNWTSTLLGLINRYEVILQNIIYSDNEKFLNHIALMYSK